MTRRPDESANGDASSEWYLRKNDGSEYGPETLTTMAQWAAESRIVAGNALSSDGRIWTPVDRIPELGMTWVAELPDGRRYGPFNVAATGDLLTHKVLPPQARIVNRASGESTTVKAYVEDGSTNQPETGGPAEGNPTPKAKPAAKRKRRKRRKAEDAMLDGQDELFAATDSDAEANRAPPQPPDSDDTDDGSDAGADGAAEQEEAGTENTGVADGEDADPDDAAAEEDAAEEEPAAAGKTAESKPVVPPTHGPAEDEAPDTDGADEEQGVKDNTDETEAGDEGAESDAVDAPPDPPPDDGALKELEARHAALQTEHDKLTKRLKAAEKETAALKEQIHAMKERDAERAGEIDALNESLAETTKARDAAQAKASEAAVAQAEAAQHSEARQREIVSLKDAVAAAERARADARDAADNDVRELEETLADVQKQLEAAHEQVRKAGRNRERAAEAQQESDKKLARRNAIENQKLKDALRERNQLATLVETQSSRITRLQMGTALLGVLLIVLGVVFVFGKGCRREPEELPGIEEAPVADDPSVDDAAAPAGPPIIEGVDGIRMLYARTGGKIVFEEGVFTSLTNVSPSVKPILRDLEPHLEKYASHYRIIVVGHTDDQKPGPESRYRTNDALALARAQEFARVLSRECDLPISRLRAIAARDEAAPFPNDDAESRSRNRTVVIKLDRNAGD